MEDDLDRRVAVHVLDVEVQRGHGPVDDVADDVMVDAVEGLLEVQREQHHGRRVGARVVVGRLVLVLGFGRRGADGAAVVEGLQQQRDARRADAYYRYRYPARQPRFWRGRTASPPLRALAYPASLLST